MQPSLDEFIAEVDEAIQRIDLNLSRVSDEQDSIDLVRQLYLDIHSVKGGSFLFGCQLLGEVTHAIESALEPIRSGTIQFSSSIIDVILPGIDLAKSLIQDLKTSGKESDRNKEVSKLSEQLTNIIALAHKSTNEPEREIAADIDSPPPESLESVLTDNTLSQSESASLDNDKHTSTHGSETAIEDEHIDDTTDTSEPAKGETVQAQSKTVESGQAEADSGGKSIDTDPKANSNKGPSDAPAQQETLRVNVNILDKLMNLVGELVLVRNQHIQYGNEHDDSELANLNQGLNQVTSELQDEIMKTRMQPIGSILSKYYRVIRDLSKDLKKEISLVIEGADTELDKTLLEAINDPLLHIVRNSADHGIESPEERQKSGKPAKGTVKIRAYHEGGQVVIEIIDDGKGLDKKRISQKALEKGAISSQDLERMSERDIFMLIFHPGLSTAKEVSNVSGRGVGMDVVRTNIEKIGGTIDLTSQEGFGTTLRLRIPLTLAIIPALLVRSGTEKFAIPQVKLVELVRVENSGNGNQRSGIEYLQGRPVFRLRGRLLPLVYLSDVLGTEDPNEQSTNDSTNIVIVNADSGIFGIIVDEIDDSADIVVKPLMQFLKDLSLYSGATVMGDGSVALTIDIVGLSSRIGIFSEETLSQDKAHAQSNKDRNKDPSFERSDYLLVDIGAKATHAVPLCLVNRLEEFDHHAVEYSGEQRLVRYRNAILPILSVADYLGVNDGKDSPVAKDPNTKTSVIVIDRNGKLIGLEVGKIQDIIDSAAQLDTETRDRPGILGNLIHEKEIVVLIDVHNVVDELLPNRFEDEPDQAAITISERRSHEILLVEDTNFFRKHVQSILEDAGYKVDSAADGQIGLDTYINNPNRFSAVLSDIEMPNMDGFELAEQITTRPDLPKVPLLALTSRFRQEDIERGKRVGFSRYMEKLNSDTLIKELDDVILNNKK